MDLKKEGISELIAQYKGDVEKLVKYLPWLEQNNLKNLKSDYNPDEGGGVTTIKVPVYDSTLLAFIKVAKTTSFMNKNYIYTFSRNGLKTTKDELRFIEKCQIMDIEKLGDILSKYVLKGMSKATLWTEGMEAGVYYAVVKKMKELIEFWSMTM